MRPLPAACLFCLLAFGCSDKPKHPPITPTPSYDPEAATGEALRAFDKDGNGSIEGAELDACPGLKAALPRLDTDKNKKLSRDELLTRLTAYKNAGDNAVTAVGCIVTVGGNPVAGAEVTFTPEPFLAGILKPASGKTDDEGNVSIQPTGGGTGGVPFGFYRISVTGDGVPAKYSGAGSPLGAEVFDDSRSVGGPIQLKL